MCIEMQEWECRTNPLVCVRVCRPELLYTYLFVCDTGKAGPDDIVIGNCFPDGRCCGPAADSHDLLTSSTHELILVNDKRTQISEGLNPLEYLTLHDLYILLLVQFVAF